MKRGSPSTTLIYHLNSCGLVRHQVARIEERGADHTACASSSAIVRRPAGQMLRQGPEFIRNRSNTAEEHTADTTRCNEHNARANFQMYFRSHKAAVAFRLPPRPKSSPFQMAPRACSAPERGANRRTDPQQARQIRPEAPPSTLVIKHFDIPGRTGRQRRLPYIAAAASCSPCSPCSASWTIISGDEGGRLVWTVCTRM